ncbi:MAG: DUF4412 domain-containing protein [bacterium]
MTERPVVFDSLLLKKIFVPQANRPLEPDSPPERRRCSGSRFLFLSCLCFCLLAALCLPAPQETLAGMIIHEQTVFSGMPTPAGPQAAPPRTHSSVLYLQGKKLRSETEKVFIVDFEAGKLLALTPEEKTYSEIGLDQLREAQKQAMQWIGSLREQMKKNLETMPPEKRAEMQKKIDMFPQDLGEQKKPSKITVRATGKEEKINGFPCKEYEILEDDQKTAVYWLTQAVSSKPFDVYQTEMGKWMGETAPLAGQRLQEWQHVRDKGFPIRIERIKPVLGKLLMSWEVKKVEEESLSESLFVPPKEYKRTEAPAMPGTLSPLPPAPPAGKPGPEAAEPQGQGG